MAIPQAELDQAQSVFKPTMGKYVFKYDWFRNPTILGLYAGSGSNDAFSFSKGDVVNAISFGTIYGDDFTAPDENSLMVENVKFDPSKPVSTFTLENAKTIQIPLEYLQKVDDSTPVTTQTGINFGQNPKPVKTGGSIILPNPVIPVPVKTTNPVNNATNWGDIVKNWSNYQDAFINSDMTLEKNSEYYLAKDFRYCENCNTNQNVIPKFNTLKKGSVVLGDLKRTFLAQLECVKCDKTQPTYKDYLWIKDLNGVKNIQIPIEYLEKQSASQDKLTPLTKFNNKNIIVFGVAFTLGYLLFSKND